MTTLTIMIISLRIPDDYDDATSYVLDRKNDRYNVAGATPRAGADPGA